MPVRSAPTQKMYGLPVTAMNAGSAASASVDGGVEAGQPARAERVRLGVVEPVVQCDECGRTGQAGHGHEPQQRLRHNLVCECRCGHFAPSQVGFSQMTVPPMPMPTHIAVSP